ncbi:restriction endonuclease [Ralstonia sp. 24A2]|uniref:restriction endonuclease n=1 Tax=Ralstonia sp. 24A2 TaxID=3447364 RepID=UPI003F69C855
MERAARARQRDIERAQREHVRSLREAERNERARQRAIYADEKERQRLYVESRIAETAELNEELEDTVATLQTILVDGLQRKAQIDFNRLKVAPQHPPLELGDLARPIEAPAWETFEPTKPSAIKSILPWERKRFLGQLSHAESLFASAKEDHSRREERRQAALQQIKEKHAAAVIAANEVAATQNAEVDELRSAFEAGNSEAIASYFSMVLASSPYPDCFPRTAETQYSGESKQLIVAYDLPAFEDSVPTSKGYKYVKATDLINESARPESQRRALYASVIGQTVLRSIHEIFSSDLAGRIEVVAFNGYVNAIDPGTGKAVRPCLVTVRVGRDIFSEMDLENVEPTACLKTLNASVSKSAAELAPVRPVVELDMSDPRFVEEGQVLSALDQRQNLMELTPSEFESLITNLFHAMGLEARQTQASRDGGVDCVAFDPRPIFGGKVVIQAKRYQNTVGVSAVRDLFGTMQNEGASKGILVTTSGYGAAAFDFANGKPIELLSGSNLLYLLQQHAGLEAKIVMPDDWRDARPDM